MFSMKEAWIVVLMIFLIGLFTGLGSTVWWYKAHQPTYATISRQCPMPAAGDYLLITYPDGAHELRVRLGREFLNTVRSDDDKVFRLYR